MMKRYLLVLLLGAATLYAQNPQIPVTGTVGAGGVFPAICTSTVTFPSDANYTPTYPAMACSSGVMIVRGSLTATRNLVLPIAQGFNWKIENLTTGGHSIQVIGSSGTGVTIANGSATVVLADGVNYVSAGGGGSGTVTTVGVATANGFQGTVSNPTTTPSISVNVDSSHVLPVNTGSASTYLNGIGTYTTPSGGINQLTGDGTAGPGTGSQALTLATVNSSPGTCGDATHVCQVTTNGKGLTTAQTAVAITGGGSIPTCGNVVTDGVSLCVTAAPYYASGQGGTTTTTSATFAVGTSGSVASCATFVANEGVYIAGAGASGANYIGTVVSCSGTTLTVTPATSTSVASGVLVQHDDTAAFQGAITALASTGGTVYVPKGIFIANGPLQDTGGANAVLKLPSVPTSSSPPLYIRIIGELPASQGDNFSASTILTNAQSGAFLGGYDSGGTLPGFTNYWLQLENLNFNVQTGNDTTGLTMIDGRHILALQVRNVWSGGGGSVAISNTASAGILYPLVLNNIVNIADNVFVTGVYTAFDFTEHTDARSVQATYCHDAFKFDSGSQTMFSGYYGNGISVLHAWNGGCHHTIVGGSNPVVINGMSFDSEQAIDADVYDPSNNLHGIVGITNPYTPANIVISGATNLQVYNSYQGWSTPPSFQSTTTNMGSFSSSAIYDAGLQLINTSAGGHIWRLVNAGSGYGAWTGQYCPEDYTSGGGVPVFCAAGNSLFKLNTGALIGWASGTPFTTNADTAFSKTAPDAVAFGNGTAGDHSGTLTLGSVVATGGAATPWAFTPFAYGSYDANSGTADGAGWRGYYGNNLNIGFNVSNGGVPATCTTAEIFRFVKDYGETGGAVIGGFDRNGNVCGWNGLLMPTAGMVAWNGDTGISRTAAGSLAVGNGTAGDASGTLTFETLNLAHLNTGQGSNATTDNCASWTGTPNSSWCFSALGSAYTNFTQGLEFQDLEHQSSGKNIAAMVMDDTHVAVPIGSEFSWSTTVNAVDTRDTGLSRTAAGTVAVGNGTPGDATGTLVLGSVQPANGFSGTKTAGTCVMTITSGIITAVTGC